MMRTRLVVTCVLLAFVMPFVAGCQGTAREALPDAPVAEPIQSEPADGGDVAAVAQPTVDQAEAAVSDIAQQMYPDFGFESVSVVGMGKDSTGRWWVQAWTKPVDEGLETEQWFVTWDGENWEYVNSGTGMERTDYPDVLEWEDIP